MSQFLLLLLTLAAAYMTPQSLAFLPCWNNDRPHNNRPQLSSGEPPGRITSTAAKAMMGVDGYFDSFASRGDNEDNDSNNNEENNGNESGDSNRDNNDSTNRDNNDNDSSSFFLVDYERYKAALEHNTRRTDVRLFLTQRAIQSFIHILIECRDPHTVRWLENMYHFTNLEKYHGTGAFNLTMYSSWDSILLDMLQQPADVVVVSARRRGRGHGGWSKDNPHLEDRFVEFEIDIEPPSLVTRIVSVRQQIAQEWVTDLATMGLFNGQILDSYHARTSQMRDQEEVDAADDTTAANVAPAPANDDCASAAFDRNAGYFLTNKITEEVETTGHTSSQLRQGSFDLLTLLATQEALHRVLRDYQQAGDERSVSHMWLKQFYADRLQKYFDGNGDWHRADDFLQELLSTPPSTVELPGTTARQAQIGLVDPLRIAQDLLQARSGVIEGWQVIMQDVVPKDHMELQKSILAVRMGKTIAPSTPAPTGSGDFGAGAFE